MSEEIIFQCGRSILAPILMNFSMWLLCEARKEGVSTLYFLSRDGYSLYQIAQYVCKRFDYNIECRYLYCSRHSLHLPIFHLNPQEAFVHIFAENMHCTLMTILLRAGVTDDQIDPILLDLQYDRSDLHRRLQTTEIATIQERAKKSTVFCETLQRNSRNAYQSSIAYLEQEGLFEKHTVALVDSGWSGTSQIAIQRLLNTKGYCGKVLGFYFGMYQEKCSNMRAWYFSKHKSFWNKVLFSPNLFECMVSAADGMTMGYRYSNGHFIPIKRNDLPEDQNRIKANQLEAILEGCQSWYQRPFASFVAKCRFRRLMAFPSKTEATSYGSLLFSDDSAGTNFTELCGAEEAKTVKAFTCYKALRNRLMHKNNPRIPYWIFGAVSLLPGRWERAWHRLNVIILEGYRWLRMK